MCIALGRDGFCTHTTVSRKKNGGIDEQPHALTRSSTINAVLIAIAKSWCGTNLSTKFDLQNVSARVSYASSNFFLQWKSRRKYNTISRVIRSTWCLISKYCWQTTGSDCFTRQQCAKLLLDVKSPKQVACLYWAITNASCLSANVKWG